MNLRAADTLLTPSVGRPPLLALSSDARTHTPHVETGARR